MYTHEAREEANRLGETTTSRDFTFDSIKANVLDNILGLKSNPIPTKVSAPIVDFRYGTNQSWLDQNRLTPNNDNHGFGAINDMMHANNNYVESFIV